MLTKEKKRQLVDELSDIVRSNSSVIFTDFGGVGTSDLNALKASLREHQVRYKVTKKSLWPFVQSKAGIVDEAAAFPGHKGSLAVAYGGGEGIEAAKVLSSFAKEHETFTILGALLGGDFVGADRVAVLAALPSREELIAKVVYVMNAPLRGLVSVLAGPQRGLVQVLAQIKK